MFLNKKIQIQEDSDTQFSTIRTINDYRTKNFSRIWRCCKFKEKKIWTNLGEFKLKKIEQEILLDAAKAHTDLLLNRKKVNINLIN